MILKILLLTLIIGCKRTELTPSESVQSREVTNAGSGSLVKPVATQIPSPSTAPSSVPRSADGSDNVLVPSTPKPASNTFKIASLPAEWKLIQNSDESTVKWQMFRKGSDVFRVFLSKNSASETDLGSMTAATVKFESLAENGFTFKFGQRSFDSSETGMIELAFQFKVLLFHHKASNRFGMVRSESMGLEELKQLVVNSIK